VNIEVNLGLVDIIGILPIIILFLVSLIPITTKILNGNREPEAYLTTIVGCLGFGAALASAVSLYSNASTKSYLFSKALVLDGVSLFATALVCLIGAVVLILSVDNKATRGRLYSEYVFLMLNSALGMIVVACSNDLIVTFIGIEVMSLCLYLIIAMSNEETLSKEAAFKYFILGSLASAIFLYGIALVFGSLGTTYIDEVLALAPTKISEGALFLFGALLVIMGLCFKVSIAPFHAWTPDVYEGAATPVTAFMATGVKVVTFVAFMRFLVGDYLASELTGQFVNVLQWLAVLTMVVGNVGAILQDSLKRMLAYSSIANSGYIMMGLIAAAVGGDSWLGATGVMYYVFAYTIMTLGAFGVLSILEKSENQALLADDLKGLAVKKPVIAACFTILLLSLAGIPPTIGFFGKFFLFSAAVKQGFFWMAVWAAINSVISVYYYLRPIVLMYMMSGEPQVSEQRMGAGALSIALMAISSVLVGIFTEPVYKFVISAVRGLF
jgi:NADH-quinone oxidoreductase subunit N